MHGGTSRGPVTAAGLERSRRARWIDGYYSAEQKQQRRAEMAEVRSFIRDLREKLARLPS
jgi:patatin-like phospholipase/acyl hydrolase